MSNRPFAIGDRPANPAEALQTLLKLAGAARTAPNGAPGLPSEEIRRFLLQIAKAVVAEGERGERARAAVRSLIAAGQELMDLAREDPSAP